MNILFRIKNIKYFTVALFLISILAATISVFIVSNHNSETQKDSVTKAGSQRNLNPDYDYSHIKMRLPFELAIGEIDHWHWIQSNKNLIQNMLSVPKSDLEFPEFKREQLSGQIEYSEDVTIFQTKLFYKSDDILDPNNELGFYSIYPNKKVIKGTIFAIHGHEENYRGRLPTAMLNETHWSQTFVKNGYRVIIPSHLFYNHARKLYANYPYHVVWTRFVSDVLDVETQTSDLKKPIFATGVSSGCTTASILTVLRSEVTGFSGGGCALPLNYLRDYYRVPNHPNQWDFKEFESELPIFTIAADKNFQFQLGTKDVLYPDGKKWVRERDGEVITSKDVFTVELAGVYVTLQKIFREANLGGTFDIKIMPLGHTIDPHIAIKFFEDQITSQHKKNK